MLIQTNRYRGYRLSVWVDSNWSPPSEAMSKRNRESQADAAAVVPTYINWSVEEVADWVESLGFPQYRECFVANVVSGRRLIWMTASTLPSMGITDWKHIQIITEKVRELLGVEPPYWNRSITLPYASDLAIFLEQKSFTGRKSDQLHYHPRTLNSSQY